MKYFTELEFSGIFSLAGGGNFASSKREFPMALLLTVVLQANGFIGDAYTGTPLRPRVYLNTSNFGMVT